MNALSMMLVAGLLLGATAAAGQDGFAGVVPGGLRAGDGTTETFGTGSLTVFPMPAVNFNPRTSGDTYDALFLPAGPGLDLYAVSGEFRAAPVIPNGAQIERIALRACDTDPNAAVTVSFAACAVGGSSCSLAGFTSTTVTGTPGCVEVSDPVFPLVVDNQTAPILVRVTTGTTSATTFSLVKLYYRLRVSPAPATATFNDVPTSHPFFRFIEALAAAGVTGGCGTGSYCPDAPVTRGQMAVFLATALGLHFPN